MNIRTFFTHEQQALIKAAIERAEHKTTGEIRLHIEGTCKGDPVQRAFYLFQRLHMHKTKYRNGILFYLAIDHKKFAVVGDEAIHQKVSDAFWEKVKNHIIEKFRNNMYTEGICEGIEMAGEELKKHFPHTTDKKNELPDEISFGKR